MKNKIMVVLTSCFLFACSGTVIEKQQPVCEATVKIGGQESFVQVYAVRKVAGQTEYKSGYPFNWRWVNKSNFTSSTCK